MSSPDAYEALRMCVEDLGGNKVVGCALRPTMAPEKAQKWLAHCLNSKKNDKLDPDQIQWIQRAAQRCGKHDGNEAWNRGVGYRLGEPITPEGEIAALQKTANEAARKAQMASAELFARMQAAGLKVEP